MQEYTLALIKPDAVEKHQIGAVLTQCEAVGLTIKALTMKTLTLDEAEHFYAEHHGKPFFPRLTQFMASGPLVAIVFEGPEAIKTYRTLMGATDPTKAMPNTLRAWFGTAGERNAVHGSDSPDSARREIGFFFPDFTSSNEVSA